MFDDLKSGILYVVVLLVLCGISSLTIGHFYPDAPLLMHGLAEFPVGVLLLWTAEVLGMIK